MPDGNLPIFVPIGDRGIPEPTAGSVEAAHALLVNEGFTRLETVAPERQAPFPVIGMNEGCPPGGVGPFHTLLHFLRGDPDNLRGGGVHKPHAAVGIGGVIYLPVHMEGFGVYLWHLNGTLDTRSTNMSFAKKVVFSLISLITAAYICGLIMLVGWSAPRLTGQVG